MLEIYAYVKHVFANQLQKEFNSSYDSIFLIHFHILNWSGWSLKTGCGAKNIQRILF